MTKDSDWGRVAVADHAHRRSFQDSSSGRIEDLPGATQQFEPMAVLDVDAIYLPPLLNSPMRDLGYDVSDYRGFRPRFRTMTKNFCSLLALALETVLIALRRGLGMAFLIGTGGLHAPQNALAFLHRDDLHCLSIPPTETLRLARCVRRFLIIGRGLCAQWHRSRKGKYNLGPLGWSGVKEM
jgi:hypothetical protein